MIDHHRCPPEAHDRDPGTARIDGAPVDEQGLLLCRDCSAPLMFCATIHDYVHVDPATAPCFLVPGSALDLVVRIQREITEDVADGIVPAAVSSFTELHDYLDANTYGGLCDDNAHVLTDTVAIVQDEVDRWLAAQGHRPTFAVRIGGVEITRIHARSIHEGRHIAERSPHLRVMLAAGASVEQTDLPGPGMRRARVLRGTHAGRLAAFDTDRDLAGLTRWVCQDVAYSEADVEEVCAARKPFAARADGSPVVCERRVDLDHAEHEAPAENGPSQLTWTTTA